MLTMKFRLALLTVIAIVFAFPTESSASGASTALMRSSRRNLVRAVKPKMYRSGIFDLKRDYRSTTRTLKRTRLVDRYTSSSRSASELKRGIPAYRHMTSVSTRRPLSALGAKKRLGLSAKPAVVERVRLSKGTSLKFNKVVGGKPGYGEITVPSHLPRSAIVKRLRLR